MAKFRGHEVPHVNIIGRTRLWFALSGFFILLSVLGLAVRGLNFSIDFSGGSLLTYPCPKCATGEVTVNDVEGTLSKFGFTDSQVQIVNGNQVAVRTSSLTTLASQPSTELRLNKAAVSVEDLRTTLAQYGFDDPDITSTPTTTTIKTQPLSAPQTGITLTYPNSKNLTSPDLQTELAKLGYPGTRIDVIGPTVVLRFGSLPVHPPKPSPSPSASPSASTAPSPTPAASPTPTVKGRDDVIAALATQEGISANDVKMLELSTPTESTVIDAVAKTAGVDPSQIGVKEVSGKEQQQLLDQLAEQAGTNPVSITEKDVGPTWGAQITDKAVRGLILFLILVSVYIAFRFEWKMAVAAQVALLHDLIITFGIYALVGRTVSPATIIAILTILGYSLYDTVVIFDKVKENTGESLAAVSRDTYSGVVNTSLNQVLMRSVNTSLVVLLPILSLLLFGGQTLKDFAFALFIGVASGTYSSIFVASPLLAVLKEREPKNRQIRARAMQRAAAPTATLRPVRTGDGGDGGDGGTVPAPAAAQATAPSGPRPAGEGAAKSAPKRRRKTTAAQRRRR
jgi:preprotein translocase subunit SecF